MGWHALAYSGILWHTLAYSGILRHTLAYSCILWHTLSCSGILWYTLAYSGILWHALAYSSIINASLITADGAYHCPVGSIWLFFTQLDDPCYSYLDFCMDHFFTIQATKKYNAA